jgi:hypothetical protein
MVRGTANNKFNVIVELRLILCHEIWAHVVLRLQVEYKFLFIALQPILSRFVTSVLKMEVVGFSEMFILT